MTPAPIGESLWLCEPGRLRQLAARVLLQRPCPTARQVAKARRAELEHARTAAARAVRATKGKVGVVCIYGPVDQRMTGELMKAGGTSTEAASASLDALLADSAVSAIVLDVDSPGGSVHGTEELADKIFAARGRKPIYAVANSLAASAAYWIATSADTVCCTPSGGVGSVGVYLMHVDESKAAEEEGVKVTYISAAKYKTEGNPHEPLSQESRDHFQGQVDRTYNKFLGALRRNRDLPMDTVRRDFGQGRLLDADQALDARMIDKVMTLEELLGKLTGGTAAASKAASAETLRLRQEHRKRTLPVE